MENSSVPVPEHLLAELRDASAQRGMWLREAVAAACRAWLACERKRRRRQRSKLHARGEQLEARQIRRLVGLDLSRTEARDVIDFVEWLRDSHPRDVAFWRGAIQGDGRA